MPVCWTGAGGEGHPVNLSWLDTHSVGHLFREIWLAVEQIPPFGRNDKKKQILRFARNDKGSEFGRRLRSSGLPGVEVFQGEVAPDAVTLFAVANFSIERGEEIERNVRGLKVFGIRVGDVMSEGSES
jgi:hypothetical protein